jgi:ATP-dependent Lon protease
MWKVQSFLCWCPSVYLTPQFCGIQVLAAHRYGIKRVILPERNLKDLSEVPSPILSGMEVCCCVVVCMLLGQLFGTPTSV